MKKKSKVDESQTKFNAFSESTQKIKEGDP